jgi:hypothetical protein
LTSLSTADQEGNREAFLDAWNKAESWFETVPSAHADATTLLNAKETGLSEVARFCIAANLARFGRITRLGPNYLEETELGLYISLMRGIPVPADRKRKLEVDRSIAKLKVAVQRNEKNDLHFQEILLTLMRKYDLAFELRDDKTFVLIPKPNTP